MTAAPGASYPDSMRLDRLLVYLRFAKTRSAACALIGAHAVRRNRQPVRRANEPARVGDILTLALGSGVRVIEIAALPTRRGSPTEAQSHYREIDLARSGITNLDTGNLDLMSQIDLAAPESGRC